MKKISLFLALAFMLVGVPALAAPGGHGPGGGPGHGPSHCPSGMHRPAGGGPHAMPGRPHGPVHVGHVRPPMAGPHHRPMPHHIVGRPVPPPPPRFHRMYYGPYYRPYYYYPSYYPSYYSSYTYYPGNYSYEVYGEVPVGGTVIVRDNYAGVNTAANVINAAANVAATIRYLTW